MSMLHVARLSEIAELNPVLQDRLAPGDSVAFVPMASVDAAAGRVTSIGQRPYSDVSKGYTPMLSGDLLVAKITPCFENGKIAQAMLPVRHGFGSTEFHVVRPHPDRVDNRYLLHYLRLQRVRAEGEKRMTGSAGQRRVPQAFLADLPVPVPTLVEQRRIAALLDQADALRAQRHKVLGKLESLAQSVFFEMFGELVGNTKGWPRTATLGEVAHIVSGVTKGRKLNGAARAVPYLAVANVQEKVLALGNVKLIDASEDEISRYRLKRNDLLLTEGGDPDKLGRGTLWQDELPECIHQNHVFRVRLHDERFTPLFLNWLVGSPRGKRYFLRSAKQTTGIASINMTQLRGFPLLEPPLALQCSFEQRIQSIQSLEAKHRTSLAYLDALFASLQHRAFRGEL